MKSIQRYKSIAKLAFSVLIYLHSNTVSAQLDWTEHLSHDRITRNNLGFLFEENNLILVMDNYSGAPATVEKITGNVKKEIIQEFGYNYDAKTNASGIGSKEILLTNPQSLDIYGLGAVSVRLTNDDLSVRSIDPIINHPCVDAIIPLDTAESMECLTDFSFDHLIIGAQGQVLESYDASPMILHEGQFENYRVQNDKLYAHNRNDTTFLFDAPNFKKLYNNPYTEELVVLLDSMIINYDPITYQQNQIILETDLIALDFTEDALYYISKVGSGYKIFKSYYSGGSNLWMNIDQAPNGQKVDFYEIAIKGLDAYMFGIHYNETTKTQHHIVQKNNLLSQNGPPRKDLAIQSFNVEAVELDYQQYEYTYEIEVINNGLTVVNTFDIYSDLQENNELIYTDIYEIYNGIMQPTDVVTFQGSFTANARSKISINIPGADFMLDSYPNDNTSSTYDLISSTDESDLPEVSISPNPTNGIIELDLVDFEHARIIVTDMYGRQVLNPTTSNNRIDISSLPKGIYYLQIMDKNRKSTISVVKI